MNIVTLLLPAQPAPSEMIWYVTYPTVFLAAEAASPFWPGDEIFREKVLD